MNKNFHAYGNPVDRLSKMKFCRAQDQVPTFENLLYECLLGIFSKIRIFFALQFQIVKILSHSLLDHTISLEYNYVPEEARKAPILEACATQSLTTRTPSISTSLSQFFSQNSSAITGFFLYFYGK